LARIIALKTTLQTIFTVHKSGIKHIQEFYQNIVFSKGNEDNVELQSILGFPAKKLPITYIDPPHHREEKILQSMLEINPDNFLKKN